MGDDHLGELGRPLGHLGRLDDDHTRACESADFSPPYYYTPASIAVYKDNTTVTNASRLDGKKIGVCGGCTYDSISRAS